MELKLDETHYQLLKECAEDSDFTRWNELVESTTEIIRLRGGDFSSWVLKGASFYTPKGEYMDLHDANFEGASIQGASFKDAKLFGASFKNASIELSSFTNADLIRSSFYGATVIITDFNQANLQDAVFEDAKVYSANLYEANFYRANLIGAHFNGGSIIPTPGPYRSSLCGANFKNARFKSSTYFENYDVSSKTDFRTVSFEAANFSQGLRHTLRYCNRRHNWNDWYKNKSLLLRTFTKLFWTLSNYGFSPKRVITSFALSTLFFAIIYLIFPKLISGIDQHDFMDSVYFSIVTMTTLGFGDMHAENNWVSQVLVIAQVLFGYVLLGSLITMLSDLFYSDGPSQELVRHGSHPISLTASMRDME